MTSQGVALGIKMSCMAIRKTFLLKCLCVLLLLFSFSSLKSITSIGFSDPENDVWHSLANEKIEMPWMDIINVYTYGSSIVIECMGPILIEDDAMPIDFLVFFSNDDDETNWEAAIHISSLGSSNLTARWVIGNLEEVTIFDWNLDSIGTHFSFHENKLTLFFTEFNDVSTSALSVEVTAELEDGSVLKDWAPDHYQPQNFEIPEIDDTSTRPTNSTTITTTTTTTAREEPASTESTSDFISTTPSLINLSWLPILLSVPLMTYLYKRRKGL